MMLTSKILAVLLVIIEAYNGLGNIQTLSCTARPFGS